MKNVVRMAVLALCFVLLTGCGCDHVWKAADCRHPSACEKCGETRGDPLEHSPGDWVLTRDVIAGTQLRQRSCLVCGEQTHREEEELQTVIQDGMFLFSPAEFMERLEHIATEHGDSFAWEFSYSDIGLQAMVISHETESLIQFFREDTTALRSEEEGSRSVWCVNLSQINAVDPDLRMYFLMACDPALSDDTAAVTQEKLSQVMEQADGQFGYYQENGLLYEVFFIEENLLGQSYSLTMLNIYASDFR